MREKIAYRFSVIKCLNAFAIGKRRFLVINLLLGLVIMLISFITPLFYKLFVNQVILQKKIAILIPVVSGYLLLFLIQYLVLIIKNYCRNCVTNRTLYRIKYTLWHDFFSQKRNDFSAGGIGNMKMLLDEDIHYLEDFSESQTIEYAISFITIVIGVILLFILEWHLALFSIIAIPLTFWLDNAVSKKEKALNAENRRNDQALTSWLHASLNGWREIRALRLEKKQKYIFVEFAHKYALYFSKWINYWITRSLVIKKIKDDFFMQFSLYFIGGLLIINKKLSIGTLLVFAMYYEIVSKAMNTVASTDAELQASMPFIDNILHALDSGQDSTHGRLILPTYGDIIFQDVSFAYPDSSVSVIHDMSFEIHRGDRVAIVGKSGSGKTTIIKLLLGLLSPVEGQILWSGVNIEHINLDSLYKKVGIVTQDSMLYNTTIKENLLYAKPNATEGEMIEACRLARIYDVIESLPMKLETSIGENGLKFSGGQRQRLVLARLFLRDVDTYILDEATSALDQYNDLLIQDAMERIAKDKTVIIVAHRESSIKLCDYRIELT